MSFVLHPWHLLLVILAGWANQLQQQIIDFQRTEIDVLKKKLGKKRIILNDDERRRLAVKAKVLGRKVLQEIGCLFTPDTLLRWHRQSSTCGSGRETISWCVSWTSTVGTSCITSCCGAWTERR